MAVVADLVINKPLGLSPPGIEFRRAHLVDINPVGVGAMGIASALSVAAHLGAFGPLAQAFSAMIALVAAMVASPLIAWATGGRFYLARRTRAARALAAADAQATASNADEAGTGAYLGQRALRRCVVCEGAFEAEDMAACPAYGGMICSLCCTLDARCDDLCKPQARLSQQWLRLLQRLLPRPMAPHLESGLAHYLLLMCLVVPGLLALFAGLYALGLRSVGTLDALSAAAVAPLLRTGFTQAFAVLLLVAGMVAWWLVLAQRSRQLAQAEARRQTQALHAQALALQQRSEALQHEIASHQRTDEALQQAKAQADAANQAKSRYITAISHELRTPLNSILGYAQLLEDDPAIPPHRRGAVQVIRRGGDHLLSLIEGTLDIARIEGGRLALETGPLHF
ncbi:MAG: hybrid sensor histidine kinase/response regulator, partial [Burkholderiales bacterium PBB5]